MMMITMMGKMIRYLVNELKTLFIQVAMIMMMMIMMMTSKGCYVYELKILFLQSVMTTMIMMTMMGQHVNELKTLSYR